MFCSALSGLQSSRDRRISFSASSTSGRIVLNLPARKADKPQWWIRGVTVESPAYLLQHSGYLMWCLYVRAMFGSVYIHVCVPLQGGWFTHWVGGCVRWVGVLKNCDCKRKLSVGVEKVRMDDTILYVETMLRDTDGCGDQETNDSTRHETQKYV